MNRYYESCPRGFCNEYTVYAVPADQAERLERLMPDARRIDRAEAIRLGTRRPAEAKRDGEQWFGGWVDGPASQSCWRPTQQTVAGRIAAAASDTLNHLHQVELYQDAVCQ